MSTFFLSAKLHPKSHKRLPNENLIRMCLAEFCQQSSQIIKNPLILYETLDNEGYFLPSKKCFSTEWMILWLRGEKDFLKRLEIPGLQNVSRSELTWETVLEMMDNPKVDKYFYHDMKTQPNLGYFYKVMEIVYPEWKEMMQVEGRS